jgi:predicted nucleic acid-binding protein
MRDRIFIDSNIFLYAFNDDDIKKQEAATDIIMNSDYEIVISLQVINEVSNNMLRKLGFKNYEIREFIEDSYKRYNVQNITKNIFLNACDIRDNYNISYYDSLILSSATHSNCAILYSEDMQHNQEIEDLRIVNPFVV